MQHKQQPSPSATSTGKLASEPVTYEIHFPAGAVKVINPFSAMKKSMQKWQLTIIDVFYPIVTLISNSCTLSVNVPRKSLFNYERKTTKHPENNMIVRTETVL